MQLRILPHKKMLEVQCHERVKLDIQMLMTPDFPVVIMKLINQYLCWLRFAIKKVNNWVDFIVKKGKDAKYKVTSYGRPCYRECATCLGKHPTHYPYFKVTQPVRKFVKEEERRDFLREIGLTEEEIRMAESWFTTLAVLYQLYNGTIKALDWLGIIEADFGEGKEVEEHGVREEG